MPELNIARYNASACSLGGNIYVVGGRNDINREINSIEILSNPTPTKDKASWKLMQPSESILSPLVNSVVVPLNANEIAIMGGSHFHRGKYQDLNDVIIYDTKKKCKKVVSSCPLRFFSYENYAAQISPNKVVAIVE